MTDTQPAPTVPDLDAIRARVEAATPGPWFAWSRGVGWLIGLDPDANQCIPGGFRTDIAREADAEFIAHARTDVPALLAEVEQLRAQWDAVLALHRPDGGVGGPGAMCVECTADFGTPAEDPEPWPCPTVRALTGDKTP